MRRKPPSTSCDSSNHREEAIGRTCDQRHLPGVCQERRNAALCVWVSVRELSGVSFQWRHREGRWQHERELYLFLERGEEADGLKGYLFVNAEKGVMKREDEEQRAVRYSASWRAGNSWSRSWQEGEGAKKRSRVDSECDGDVSIWKERSFWMTVQKDKNLERNVRFEGATEQWDIWVIVVRATEMRWEFCWLFSPKTKPRITAAAEEKWHSCCKLNPSRKLKGRSLKRKSLKYKHLQCQIMSFL